MDVRSDRPETHNIGGMQSKRQDTIATMIPCLYSFLLTVLTLAVELPANKKRTRTLFHKESGSYNLGRHSYALETAH